MRKRTQLTTIGALAVLIGAPSAARAMPQELSRFRVLVPDLEPLDDADRDFGEDVAEELRELLSTLTHRAVERREIERTLDEVDLDMDELDCVLTRQLGAMIEAQVVLCASYTEVEKDRFAVTAVFWGTGSGESFEIDATTGVRREEEAVAQHIFDQFDRYTRHLRAATNCEDYAGSSLWDDALRNCDEALSLNPGAVGTRYRRARILFDTDRDAEALVELERVLDQDPIHEAALELAGYVSVTVGRQEDGLAYYSRYLQLSPGNAAVRMRVAYDIAQAGDVDGAMLLVREGLDVDPDNVDLWEQYGGYAFSIGEAVNREQVTDRGCRRPGPRRGRVLPQSDRGL